MSITLDQVTKHYAGVPVVNDVSLDIGEGEFFVLLGPSGSGKSTLLRAGELTEASAAAVHVVLGGEVLMPPNSRRILPGTTRGAVEELAARVATRGPAGRCRPGGHRAR